MFLQSFSRNGDQGLLSASFLETKLKKAFLILAFVLTFPVHSQQPPPTPTSTATPSPTPTEVTEIIQFRDADLETVIKVFSAKAKRNYILDERVKGKVTVYVPKANTLEAVHILDALLAFKGFTAVPIGDNLWKIVPSKDAKQSTIPTLLDGGEREPTASIVTRLVNLKYVSADDMKQLIAPLVSPDGLLNAYTGTNSLIIIDSDDNIERLVKLITALDVPSKDREMVIIPVKFADAGDIAQKLNEILGEADKSDAARPYGLDLSSARLRESMASAARASAAAAATGASPPGSGSMIGSGGMATVAAISRQPKIIADERTNSVIVVADDETIARIRGLINQLDSKLDLSGNRFYVYRCQHADAEDLAEVLAGLSGEDGAGTTTGTSRTSSFGDTTSRTGSRYGSNMGSSRNRNNDGLGTTSDRLASTSRTPGEPRSRSEGGGVKSATLGENISITADPATNSLIINASKTDYLKILELLKELDIRRRQVLVEATLLEVAVEDSTTMGFDFLTSTGGSDGGVMMQSQFGTTNLTQLLSDPRQVSAFSVAAASAGSLKLPGGIVIPTQAMLLNAAQSNSNVNILSAPSILTTDNEEAEIVVGQNVPFLASTSTSEDNLNNTFNQIDRQDVGITLRLTPQISSGDTVTLNIFTEVSAVVPSTANSTLGPTTTIRTSQTTVITKDGQLVIIGGLMADDNNQAESGVPFFKDIPVLGHAFRDVTEDHRRRNLLIFITPRVIVDQFDARDVTLAMRDEIEETIERNEIYPSREDVLRNFDLERTSETSSYDGPKPGTIRASKSALENKTEISDSRLGDSLELKASPELPEERASLSPSGISPRLFRSRAGTSYIVLKLDNQNGTPKDVPFTVNNNLFGVVLPEESSSHAKEFFEIGSGYLYNLGGNALKVTPLGVFSSDSEARSLFPELGGDWHTLSPFEVMNLGNDPWVKIAG